MKKIIISIEFKDVDEYKMSSCRKKKQNKLIFIKRRSFWFKWSFWLIKKSLTCVMFTVCGCNVYIISK